MLAAILPRCEHATLAFCLENEPETETSWLSIWSPVGKTFQQCGQRVKNLPGCEIGVEVLKRNPAKNRFAENSTLAWLEKNWAQPPRADSKKSANHGPQSSISLVACQNPEAEAVFAARGILKFVRAGARFRDCAVLVRNLDGYHKPLAREFRRYGVPFFLDCRESVAHHPLAELTRSAFRTIAFDWRHDDWFAALKAGFSSVEENEIDRLENAALEFGWRGKKWREPLPSDDHSLERLRKMILPPFENFAAQLERHKNQPSGGNWLKPCVGFGMRSMWKKPWSDGACRASINRQSPIASRKSTRPFGSR